MVKYMSRALTSDIWNGKYSEEIDNEKKLKEWSTDESKTRAYL